MRRALLHVPFALVGLLTLLVGAAIARAVEEATPPGAPASAPPSDAALASLAPELVSVSVANLDTSARWYAEKLGFREIRRMDLPDHALRIAFVEKNGFRLELIEFKDSVSYEALRAKFPSITDRARMQGFGKLAFRVADLDAMSRHLKSKDAKLAFDVTLDDDSAQRWLVALDPDGNWIQIFEQKK